MEIYLSEVQIIIRCAKGFLPEAVKKESMVSFCR